MTELSDRLWQPCPLCNADATIAPGSSWPCDRCDGRRFIPTAVTQGYASWMTLAARDIPGLADDAERLARGLRLLDRVCNWRASAGKGGD